MPEFIRNNFLFYFYECRMQGMWQVVQERQGPSYAHI